MLYGRKCRAPICWDQVGERVIEGPEMIEVTNAKVAVAKEKLKEARTRQKSYADKHRRSLEFQPGDHVFLKVSPARGVRRFGIKGKLSPRFIRPFEILDQVGEVSYRLALPPQLSHVHDVFHVSLLKGGYKYHPLHVISYPLDQIRTDLSYVEEPEAVLDRQDRVMRKRLFLSSRFFGGTIPSGKPLGKPRSLSELLILISSHDMRGVTISNVALAPMEPGAFQPMTIQQPNWNMGTGASSYLTENTCGEYIGLFSDRILWFILVRDTLVYPVSIKDTLDYPQKGILCVIPYEKKILWVIQKRIL
nr:putative nucleotidyltransferase, ribonuclease H [Tanacetum cinerariifolium]